MNACVRWKADEEKFRVVVVIGSHLDHCRELTRDSHAQYSSSRLVVLDEVHEVVDLLRRTGAKKLSIRMYILQHSDAAPNSRDVTNIVKKLKERDKGTLTTAERLR